MIFGVTVTILGYCELRPYKVTYLINKRSVCSDCSTNWSFAISLTLLWPPYSLSYNNIEIRPINNPTMASKCSSRRKGCTSLILNQKLEMI